MSGGGLRLMRGMKVSRFEYLEIWQIARRIYKKVYEITSRPDFDNKRKPRAQMRS